MRSRIQRPGAVVRERGRFVQLAVRHRPVGARNQHLARLPLIDASQDLEEEEHEVVDVQVRHGGPPLPAQHPSVPRLRQPRLEEHEQRRVLAPVGEQRRKPRDDGMQPVAELEDHRLALAGRDRGDMLAVRRALLVYRAAGSRGTARQDRTGKHEVPDTGRRSGFQHVPQADDVGSPVLGILAAGEIVVRREVDDRLGPATLGDLAKDGSDLRPLRHVGLEPRQVGVGRDAAPMLRPPRNSEDPIVVAERLDQVPPDETRRACDDQSRKGHTRIRRAAAIIYCRVPLSAKTLQSPASAIVDIFNIPSWRPPRSL
jgi:hypothetical protein